MKKTVPLSVFFGLAGILAVGCDPVNTFPPASVQPNNVGGSAGGGNGGALASPLDSAVLSDAPLPDLAVAGPDLATSPADAPIDAPLPGSDALLAPPSPDVPAMVNDSRCIGKSPGQYVSPPELCSVGQGTNNGLKVCRWQFGFFISVCDPQTPPAFVKQDASPSLDTATVVVSPDAAPSFDSAALSDAQVPPVDTQPAVCDEGRFDPKMPCVISIDGGGTALGFWGCQKGKNTCVDINPPQNSASCAGYAPGEIYSYSACSPFPGCAGGQLVCDGSNWMWKCQLFIDWYTSPSCLVPVDAGVSGMGGSVGTGGAIGTGGSSATGGAIGTGGIDGGSSIDSGSVADAPPAPHDALAIIDISFGDVNFANGWPLIDCTNADVSGDFINIVLRGPIDGNGNDGVSNLIDEQSSSWVNPLGGPAICMVGNVLSWGSRLYCQQWTPGQTLAVFSGVPVDVFGTTEINYVIDNGVGGNAGRQIWGRNQRLNFAVDTPPAFNRCFFSTAQNLSVGPNVAPNGGG